MKTLEERIFSAPDAFVAANLDVDGHLPTYVKGTYYLNGPGLFERNNIPYEHWLDGDGIVRRIVVTPYSANYTSTYVMSRKVETEIAENQPLYRNFGTSLRFSRLNEFSLGLEGNVNVSVYLVNDKLLAFGEQTMPYELMQTSLETLNKCSFNNQIRAELPFSGHPKWDSKKDKLFNFGIRYLKTRAMLHFFEFNEDFSLSQKGSAGIPYAANIHDFAISDDYALFYITPYILNWTAFQRSSKPLMKCLEWDPEQPSQVLVINRKDCSVQCRLSLPRGNWCLHLVAARNDSTHITLDLIEAPAPYFDQYLREGLFTDIKPSNLLRLEIDAKDGLLKRQSETLLKEHIDFPATHPNPGKNEEDLFWALAMPTHNPGEPSFYNRIVCINAKTGDILDDYKAPKNHFFGAEPVIIANPSQSDDAVVMIQEYDLSQDQSRYVFFRAFQLNYGPIAKIHLPQFDPIGFHSSWVPSQDP